MLLKERQVHFKFTFNRTTANSLVHRGGPENGDGTNHENVPSSGLASLLVASPVSIGEDLEYEELLLADRNTHVNGSAVAAR